MQIHPWPARLAVVLTLSLAGPWSCSQPSAAPPPTTTPPTATTQRSAMRSSTSAVVADRAKPLSLAPEPDVITDAQNTLTYLASDELEGRGVGTKGLDLAADYIAD